ncbi:MAG: MFS transporter [Actinomycetes bacterium]
MARALAALLQSRGYRRLLTVRLLSQFTDGVLQAALAGLFFFAPERQSTTREIAAAFAVLLLPYSLVGPFTGVLLDRWRRRQVLLFANLVRAAVVAVVVTLVASQAPLAAVEVTVLVALGVNRFLLSALSAGLPHVVPTGPTRAASQAMLVSANSVTPTVGSCAFLVGLVVGGAIRGLTASDPPALAVAVVGYVVAGASALRLRRDSLGPEHLTGPVDLSSSGAARAVEPARLRDVLPGLRAAGAHLRERRRAGLALLAMATCRAGYGAGLLAATATIRAGSPASSTTAMADLALVLGASGAGFLVAAVLAPAVAPRVGASRWLSACLGLAALGVAAVAVVDSVAALVTVAGVLGFALQGVKIATDTLVQHEVDDEYRGRVFSLYDVLYNASFVAAAVAWAQVWPEGRTREGAWLLIAAVFALAAALHALACHRLDEPDVDATVLRLGAEQDESISA